MVIDPINILTTQNIASFFKILIIILEAVYTMFAFLTVRQVRLMNVSFITSIKALFSLVARVHLLFSIGLILLSILFF
jgi:hypothetical protein